MPHPDVTTQAQRTVADSIELLEFAARTIYDHIGSGDFEVDPHLIAHVALKSDDLANHVLDVAEAVWYRDNGGRLYASQNGYQAMWAVLTMATGMLRTAIAPIGEVD